MNCLQNFINNYLSVDNNTSATILITLFVFLLGYLVSGILKAINNYNTRSKQRALFRNNITSICRATATQCKNILLFADKLKISHVGNYDLQSTIISNLYILKQINYDIYYSSYFHGFENFCKKYKIKSFNRVYLGVEAIENIQSRTIIEIEKFNELLRKYKNQWDIAIENVKKFNNELIDTTNGQSIPSLYHDYLKMVNKIFIDFKNSGIEPHYDNVFQNFIKPLMDLNSEPKNEKLPIYTHSNDLLMEAKLQYDNLKVLFELYNGLYNEFAHTLKVSNRIMIKCLKILK